MNELDRSFATWDYETQGTVKLLRALPKDKYDFRPDPDGRSLGELAWHLAEGDGYITQGIDTGVFFGDVKPQHMERLHVTEKDTRVDPLRDVAIAFGKVPCELAERTPVRVGPEVVLVLR